MVFNITNYLQNEIIQFNILLLIIGFTLYKKYNNKLFLLLVFFVFICNEIIYYFTGIDIYKPSKRTELFYNCSDLSSILPSEHMNINTNFTEGHFKSDKCISWQESEINRFEHFIEILNIKEGDYVLDAGCGFGGLVSYFRKKGINAYGINISKTQYRENIKKIGDYFYHGDYTIFNRELVNKFDFIIMPGSLEHTYGGNPQLISTYKNKYKNMSNLFNMMKKYFKYNSIKKKILTTTLHLNKKFMNTWQGWVLERIYGGSYPLINKYSVADSLKNSGYKILEKKDKTWHYYYPSYCNLSHFGNPYNIGETVLLFLPLYPHIIYIYIYTNLGGWMWQFDGKNHKRRNTEKCIPQKGCDLTFEKNINKRPTTLFYTIAQLT